jgi:two-component system, LuxR family, response regulator FixJ
LQTIVHVVDDDEDVRTSIGFMLEAAGHQVNAFAGGEEFLQRFPSLDPGAIVLDLRMPEVDGFQVLATLNEEGVSWPAIVMTGHGEVPVAVKAMKLGAIDFLEKPFGEEALLGALTRAFQLLQERVGKSEARREAQERVEKLTGRESEVLRGLLAGLSNKLIARKLDISLRTVEMHRANMMDRLGVGSLAEALTLAVQADVEPGELYEQESQS